MRQSVASSCGCHACSAGSLRGGVERDRSAQDVRCGAIGMDVSLRRAAFRAAISCGQGHRRAVSYPGRSPDRCCLPGQAQGRYRFPESVCGRRRCRRRIGFDGGGLSVGKWPFDRDRAWPFGGASSRSVGAMTAGRPAFLSANRA